MKRIGQQLCCVFSVVLVVFLTAMNLSAGDRSMRESNSNLDLDLKFERVVYSASEEVVIRVIFGNTGNEDLVINTAYNLDMQKTFLVFDIVMPSGSKPVETLPILGRRPPLSKKDFRGIPQGGSLVVDVPISKWYKLSENGEYRLAGHYFNSDDGSSFKLRAWTGNVRTRVYTFRIS